MKRYTVVLQWLLLTAATWSVVVYALALNLAPAGVVSSLQVQLAWGAAEIAVAVWLVFTLTQKV